jgi:thiol-disulfide isomerase/thioredoxin
MWSWKAWFVVLITAGLLSIPMYFYWEFLTQGMAPPKGTQILNKLEKEGVPNFSLPDLNGKMISLTDFKGKILLVNIWATWCAPCVKEFPSMRGLVEHFKGQVAILAVSHDKSREDIDSFIKTFGGLPEDFVVVWDREKKVAELFGTDVLPETYLLSKDQKLLRKVAGETVWNEPMALEFFQELLDKENSKSQVKPVPEPAKEPDKIKTH